MVALHAEGSEVLNRSIKLAGAAAILIAAIYLPLYARAHVRHRTPRKNNPAQPRSTELLPIRPAQKSPERSLEFLWDKKYTVQTNADGMYTIQLEPGTYDVQVQEFGFSIVRKERLLLSPGSQIELNFKLMLQPSRRTNRSDAIRRAVSKTPHLRSGENRPSLDPHERRCSPRRESLHAQRAVSSQATQTRIRTKNSQPSSNICLTAKTIGLWRAIGNSIPIS